MTSSKIANRESYIMAYREVLPKNFKSQSKKFTTLLKAMEIRTKQKEKFTTLLVTPLYNQRSHPSF